MLFLQTRLRLFIRTLHAAGWGLTLLALLLSLGVIIAFLTSVANNPVPAWGAALSIPIFLWHIYRDDGRFLRHLGLPLRQVLFFLRLSYY